MRGIDSDQARTTLTGGPMKALARLLLMLAALLVAIAGVAASTVMFLVLTGTFDQLPPLRP